MTALANAFRRAAGMPESNFITSKFEIEQAEKKHDMGLLTAVNMNV